MKYKKIALQTTTAVVIIVMLLFFSSTLKPYFALFLALAMFVLIILWSFHHKNKIIFGGLIITLVLSVGYIVAPVKFIVEHNQVEFARIVPIGYGLPSEKGWSQIKQGSVYPGGDVVHGPFNPRYVIMIGR